MDEALFTLMARLIRIDAELGEVVYERAVHDALVAVAAAVLHEAEAAGKDASNGDAEAKVLPFPVGRNRRPDLGTKE